MFGKNFRYFQKTLRFSGICPSKEDVTTYNPTYRKISLSQTKDNKCMYIMPFRIIKYSL